MQRSPTGPRRRRESLVRPQGGLPALAAPAPAATGVDTFVDAFGGSGNVICSRPPVVRNIYSERDRRLVDLFRLLQDHAAAERLVAALCLTPWHRAEYDHAVRGAGDAPVERSRQFVVWAVQRAIMTADAAWRFHRRAHTTHILRPWAAVATELLAIQPAAEHLTVLHRDDLVVSACYDSPTTLHYFDPPYLLGFDSVYHHRFGPADHQRLADAAHRRRGRVAISGYRSAEYDLWFRDWYRWNHPTSRECLWTSYAP